MKKLKSLPVFLIAMSIICLSFTNCEVAEETVCNTDAAYNSYISALNSFSNNPTRTNCNNLKTKANAFITAAGNCSGVDVSGPKSTINSIDCSDF